MSALSANFVAALGSALLDVLWQGALVGLAAAVALALLRGARPQARYLVACTALALCLLLPAATLVRTLDDGASLASAPAADLHGDAVTAAAPATPPASADAAPAAAASTWGRWRAWRDSLQPQLPLLVGLWSLGAGLLTARMALGLVWVAGVGGVRGRPHHYWQAQLDALGERMHLPRRVLLRVVDGLDSPAAARIWRPVVLLPAALVARMPADLLEALLAHELAHVRRHDYLVNLLQCTVETLLFHHPVVWWLSRRIREERELIADDLATQAIGDPRRLARALAMLADTPSPVPTPTLAPAAAGGNLMNRIQRLLRPRPQALDWKTALPVLALSAACAAAFAQSQPAPAAPSGIVATIANDAPPADSGDADITREAALAEREAARVDRDAVRSARDADRAARGGDGDYALLSADGNGPSMVSASLDDLRRLDDLRMHHGDDVLWLRRDGRDWVITDPALIARVRSAWEPTEAVGREMEALGSQMERHGEAMAAIGARMEAAAESGTAEMEDMQRLGEEMSELSVQHAALAARRARLARDGIRDDDARRAEADAGLAAIDAETAALDERMSALSRRMDVRAAEFERAHAPLDALSQEMERAGEPMEALGDRMEELGERMEAISERADATTRDVIEQAVREGKLQPAGSIATR